MLLWEKLKEIRNTVYVQTGHPEGASFVRVQRSELRRKNNTWRAKAKRRERRGQKEARGVRDELEREREGISKSSLRKWWDRSREERFGIKAELRLTSGEW